MALKILYAGLAILVLLVYFGPDNRENNDKYYAETHGKELSIAACQDAIKTRAHDPDSVNFEPLSTVKIINQQNSSIVMQISFRAKNGFNALILSKTECVTEKIHTEWVVSDIKEIRDQF